jgi:hypothetical protein
MVYCRSDCLWCCEAGRINSNSMHIFDLFWSWHLNSVSLHFLGAGFPSLQCSQRSFEHSLIERAHTPQHSLIQWADTWLHLCRWLHTMWEHCWCWNEERRLWLGSLQKGVSSWVLASEVVSICICQVSNCLKREPNASTKLLFASAYQ